MKNFRVHFKYLFLFMMKLAMTFSIAKYPSINAQVKEVLKPYNVTEEKGVILTKSFTEENIYNCLESKDLKIGALAVRNKLSGQVGLIHWKNGDENFSIFKNFIRHSFSEMKRSGENKMEVIWGITPSAKLDVEISETVKKIIQFLKSLKEPGMINFQFLLLNNSSILVDGCNLLEI
jgi:hypothetical protein